MTADEVLADTLRALVNTIGAAIKQSWLWLIVVVLVSIPVTYLLYSSAGIDGNISERKLIWYILGTGSVAALSTLLAISSFAINWHRYLLLGDEPRRNSLLRLDGPVWRYLLNGISASVIVFIVALLPLLILGMMGVTAATPFFSLERIDADGQVIPEQLSLSKYVISTAIGGLVGGLFLRLSLKFPAIALGRKDMGFRASWQLTRGHYLMLSQVAGAVCVAAILGGILDGQVSALVENVNNGFASAGIYLLFAILETWLAAYLYLTLLSILFGQFVLDQEESAGSVAKS